MVNELYRTRDQVNRMLDADERRDARKAFEAEQQEFTKAVTAFTTNKGRHDGHSKPKSMEDFARLNLAQTTRIADSLVSLVDMKRSEVGSRALCLRFALLTCLPDGPSGR